MFSSKHFLTSPVFLTVLWFIEKCITCLISKFGEVFCYLCHCFLVWVHCGYKHILYHFNPFKRIASFTTQVMVCLPWWMVRACLKRMCAVLLLEGGVFSKCQFVHLAASQLFCPGWFCRHFYHLLRREERWQFTYNSGPVCWFQVCQFLHHAFCTCYYVAHTHLESWCLHQVMSHLIPDNFHCSEVYFFWY